MNPSLASRPPPLTPRCECSQLDIPALEAACVAGSAAAALAPLQLPAGPDPDGGDGGGGGGSGAAALAEVAVSAAVEQRPSGGGALDALFVDVFGKLDAQSAALRALPSAAAVGPLRVDAGGVRDAMVPRPARRAAELRAALPRVAGGAWLFGQ